MPDVATDSGSALASMQAFAEPPTINDAAELLAAAPLHSIACGFLTSSYVLGAEGDRALEARLESGYGVFHAHRRMSGRGQPALWLAGR